MKGESQKRSTLVRELIAYLDPVHKEEPDSLVGNGAGFGALGHYQMQRTEKLGSARAVTLEPS